LGSSYQATLPLQQTLSQDDARADLAYLIEQISLRHESAVNGLPDAVRQQYLQELANLPSNPTVMDIWQASSKILTCLNDGHSRAGFIEGWAPLQLDLQLLMINNSVVCNTSDYCGMMVVAINNIPISSLYARFLTMFSHENLYWVNYSFPSYLIRPETLGWLGVSTGQAVQVEFENDTLDETVTIPFVSPPSTQAGSNLPFVRYTLDPSNNLAILTLDQCTYNQTYIDTVKDFFAAIKNADIQNIAVDLRANGGGSSEVVNEFLRYLPITNYTDYGALVRYGPLVEGGGPSQTASDPYTNLTFHGTVYVLTSSGTFSSAMMFAVILRDNNLCRVIGQPPGNKPSSYGDVLSFQMPNSKLFFTLTYKQFFRPDVSKNSDDALMPDYPTNVTLQGDGVMNELYALVAGNS
jgi:hypothetical protein